jgi:DNA-directed RNA polymerase alpha subunit
LFSGIINILNNMNRSYHQHQEKVIIIEYNDYKCLLEYRHLEPGFGITIGNSLRRVLLSYLEGFAITSIKIDGITHEFSVVPGILEDITEIVLNFKKIRFKRRINYHINKETVNVTIKKDKKPYPFLAGYLEQFLVGFQVLNKNLILFNKYPDYEVHFTFTIEKGRGYVPAEFNKKKDAPIGTIFIDSIYSPILNVKYHVETYTKSIKYKDNNDKHNNDKHNNDNDINDNDINDNDKNDNDKNDNDKNDNDKNDNDKNDNDKNDNDKNDNDINDKDINDKDINDNDKNDNDINDNDKNDNDINDKDINDKDINDNDKNDNDINDKDINDNDKNDNDINDKDKNDNDKKSSLKSKLKDSMYEKLCMEIITDGSIHPKEAIKAATNILIKYFLLFIDERVINTYDPYFNDLLEDFEYYDDCDDNDQYIQDLIKNDCPLDVSDYEQVDFILDSLLSVNHNENQSKYEEYEDKDNQEYDQYYDDEYAIEEKSDPTEFIRKKKLLSTNISDLGLSIRAKNFLKSANIKKLWQLVIQSEIDLKKMINFGIKTMYDIKKLLKQIKFSLNMDISKYILSTYET